MKAFRTCERYFTPAGRIIIGAFFVLAGVGKVFDIAGTAAYIESVGLPAGTFLAIVAILIEVGFGGMLLIGLKARYAALGLALFTFIASLLFHTEDIARDMVQQTMFMKNMAIMGGLLFIAAHIGAPCCTTPAHKHDSNPTPTL